MYVYVLVAFVLARTLQAHPHVRVHEVMLTVLFRCVSCIYARKKRKKILAYKLLTSRSAAKRMSNHVGSGLDLSCLNGHNLKFEVATAVVAFLYNVCLLLLSVLSCRLSFFTAGLGDSSLCPSNYFSAVWFYCISCTQVDAC